MRRTVAALAALACVAAACTVRDEAEPTPTATATPGTTETASPTHTDSPAASPTPTPGAARFLVYVDRRDLWIYDVESDSVRRLTTDADRRDEESPRFVDPSTVWFTTDTEVRSIEVRSRAERQVARRPARGGLFAFDVSRRGDLAFIAVGPRDVLALYVRRRGAGEASLVRRFRFHVGRGASDDDDISLAWSPDGRRLVVVDTALAGSEDGDPSMFVVGRDGADVLPPRGGTHAIWSQSSKRLFYREFTGARRWWSLDVPSGRRSALGIKPGTVRPVLSPDASSLAYDDGGGDRSTYVLDLDTGIESRVATDAVAPRWLSARALAVTDVEECRPDGDCDGAWVLRLTASRIDLDSGRRSVLPISSTLHSDVLYEASAARDGG